MSNKEKLRLAINKGESIEWKGDDGEWTPISVDHTTLIFLESDDIVARLRPKLTAQGLLDKQQSLCSRAIGHHTLALQHLEIARRLWSGEDVSEENSFQEGPSPTTRTKEDSLLVLPLVQVKENEERGWFNSGSGKADSQVSEGTSENHISREARLRLVEVSIDRSRVMKTEPPVGTFYFCAISNSQGISDIHAVEWAGNEWDKHRLDTGLCWLKEGDAKEAIRCIEQRLLDEEYNE